jgi:hypothetical protein
VDELEFDTPIFKQLAYNDSGEATVERDGFRVVTPRESGVAPVAVDISRRADTVLVRKAAAATN